MLLFVVGWWFFVVSKLAKRNCCYSAIEGKQWRFSPGGTICYDYTKSIEFSTIGIKIRNLVLTLTIVKPNQVTAAVSPICVIVIFQCYGYGSVYNFFRTRCNRFSSRR